MENLWETDYRRFKHTFSKTQHKEKPMKKKLLFLTLISVLALTLCACSSSKEEEDPAAQKEAISGIDNEEVAAYLNQYNLDAENTIASNDLTTNEDGSITCEIAGIDVKFVTSKEGLLTVKLSFEDLENEDLDVVARDLLIAMDSELTYDDASKMLKEMHAGGKDSFNLGGVNVKLKKTESGYELRMYSPLEDILADYDSLVEDLNTLENDD